MNLECWFCNHELYRRMAIIQVGDVLPPDRVKSRSHETGLGVKWSYRSAIWSAPKQHCRTLLIPYVATGIYMDTLGIYSNTFIPLTRLYAIRHFVSGGCHNAKHNMWKIMWHFFLTYTNTPLWVRGDPIKMIIINNILKGNWYTECKVGELFLFRNRVPHFAGLHVLAWRVCCH